MWLIRLCGPWIFKAVLMLLLFANTGALGVFQQYEEEAEVKKNMSYREFSQRRIPVVNLCKQLLDAAREKISRGEIYSPYDYFRDLSVIQSLEVELEVGHSAIPEIQALLQYSYENIKNGRYGERDIIGAQKMYPDQVEIKKKKYHKEFVVAMKELGWNGFFSWLLAVYLKNLLPALLLYLAWMSVDERKGRRQMPHPLNLLLITLAHPYHFVVIFIKWVKKTDEAGRRYIIEAEYRRTKEKLFVYLSKEETERIKQFAESELSLATWRERLSLKGLKPVHSLVAALAVTLLFTFLPKPAEAKKADVKNTVTMVRLELSSHLARMSIADDKSVDERCPDGGADFLDGKVFRPECFDSRHFLRAGKVSLLLTIFSFQEVLRKIEHVPLAAV